MLLALAAALALFLGLLHERAVLEQQAVQAAADYTQALAVFRTLYTEEVVAAVLPLGVEVTHDYAERPHAIPLPATLSMELGARISGSGGGSTRLYSPHPFPWRAETGGLVDAFDQEAWAYLTAHPTESFYRLEGDRIRYATADRMRAACVGCHNSHPDTPRSGWAEGDVRGVLEVSLPIISRGDAISGTWDLTVLLLLVLVPGLALSALAVIQARARKDALDVAQARADANEALEERNSELAAFASVLAHDLLTPLQSITLSSSMVREAAVGKLDPNDQRALELLERSSLRMGRLVDDLLEYSSVGASALTAVEVSLDQVLDEVIQDLSIGDEITRTTPLPTVMGSDTRLRQLVQNLVANAIKFAGDPPRVTVSAKRTGGRWEVAIADNGRGIAPDALEAIFAVFRRGPDVKDVEGTGIGLAVARKIVMQHGGHIWAESTPGEGATFRFTLPAAD
ncbi:MAG: DUF3365 domain-containing protein [Proteobacteria bacterium]|nr:DUF3365 domain-containing protein [Pseudomonadota bacterium]